MFGPESWTRALAQADTPTRFPLSFARLGLTAECHSLSAEEISQAMALSGEAAARQLLYLACPSLQQAGEAMTATGSIARAADITLKLPYSDVLQAASLILRNSGGGMGMVSVATEDMQPTKEFSLSTDSHGLSVPAQADAPTDGYALLRQWAAEDRAAELSVASRENHDTDTFSATRQLQQAWAQEASSILHPAETQSAIITAEQVAWELCRRLQDAAGNM